MAPSNELRTDIPHSARIYDYLLGGKDNFAPDRAVAEKILLSTPGLPVSMRANRRFMARVTRFLARRGFRQFLDVGTGLPTRPNLHEVAQREVPEAAVVYVDNDPLVLVHARALLTTAQPGLVTYLEADLREPKSILEDPQLATAFDLTQPVALTMIAVLQHVTEPGQDRRLIEAMMDRLAPGSALVISTVTVDNDPDGGSRTVKSYNSAGVPAVSRTREETLELFSGLELAEPGLVPVHRWQPEEADLTIDDKDVYMYGGVAFKPPA
jgi:O-methyltransferase involved in polyketide biosynthesis